MGCWESSPLLPCEEAQMAEAFPAAATLVGPPGQLQRLLDAAAVGPPEDPATLGAHAGSLPAAPQLMPREAALLPQGFPTVTVWVWPALRVDRVMLGEACPHTSQILSQVR